MTIANNTVGKTGQIHAKNKIRPPYTMHKNKLKMD